MKKPNILLLTADQQRYDTIGCVNAPYMLTPSLDRLAKEGCTYTHAHTPNPVCISARHNILTGLSARYHNLPSNVKRFLSPFLPTLPRILTEHGFYTAAIGKMHFNPVRAHHGFDVMKLMEEIPGETSGYPGHIEEDDYLQYLKSVGLGHLLHIHGVRHIGYQLPQRSLLDEKHHGSTWVGRESSNFIESNKDRPWFLWASWIAPHPPANVSDSFANLYKGAKLPEVRGLNGKEKPEHRRFRELYFAAISQVDKNVGVILETLDRCNLSNDTLIIYTSDHGEMLGDLGLRTKQLPYDTSVRIPFIVRYPGFIKKNTICKDFVDLNDILPTVLDTANIDIEQIAKQYSIKEFPGESLLGPSKKRDRNVEYAEWGEGRDRWIMMRDKKWKYIYWFQGAIEELYNLEDDPNELKDLLKSDDKKNSSILLRLRNLALSYESKWGLKGTIKNGKIVSFNSKHKTIKEIGYDITPDWSIRHWPSFIKKWDKNIVKQLEKEIDAVVEKEPLGKESRSKMEKELIPIWWKEYKSRNGKKLFYQKLFCGCKK
ncbi:MAG: sulfatase-like hydrolase/transferase [Candidatus Firestonebacteria bacterium]